VFLFELQIYLKSVGDMQNTWVNNYVKEL